MENDAPAEDTRSSRRGRLMGKLFGRDRKSSNEDSSGDLNDFFHGASDRLDVAHPGPPVLAKLDITSATRYPNALEVINRSQQSLPLRPQTDSPRHRNKKGFVVRFVDTFPEIIGEGGDEAELPTAEIGKMRRMRLANEAPRPQTADKPARGPTFKQEPAQGAGGSFDPTPPRRTQTGYTPVSATFEPAIAAGNNAAAKYLDSPVVTQDEKRKSFIEVHQAEQRQAEGLALAKAVRSASGSSQPAWEESRHSPALPAVTQEAQKTTPPYPSDSPDGRLKKPTVLDQSPASIYSMTATNNQSYSLRQAVRAYNSSKDPGTSDSPQKASMNLQEVVVAAGDDAYQAFVSRTKHLFELFRLQAETVRPLSSCSAESLARAAVWWFLQGRMSLENSIRARPASPEAHRQSEMARQQAYADLAKGYWLVEEILPEVLASKASAFDEDAKEVRKNLGSQLRKLCISMKRNGFLPPAEAFLPQQIDKTIWVEYPAVNQDVVMLLWGVWGSALAQADRLAAAMDILDALPLGDTARFFSFGRVFADAFLMEQGRESQSLYFPCFLSTVRPLKQPGLELVLASQDGTVQLRIQASKNAGATWDSVRWRPDATTLEIRLPRGFVVAVQLAPPDYNLIWNMYDFGAKVHATLFPRQDEQVVFRSSLRAFQYFDSDPQSKQFPKEVVSSCEVAMFERIHRETAATGPRSYHMGCRLAVVTGPRTRTLSGVNHAFIPQMPVQFGFLRGEQDDPALLLKFGNGRSKGSMVLSFNDEKERMRLHSLLIGTELHHDETVCCEAPLAGFTISQMPDDVDGLAAVKRLPWQRVRIINDDHGGHDVPQTVLSDRMRVVLEFKHGTLTDRVNVAPGEFRIRLDVKDLETLAVFRQPQSDMTVAISEAQVPRDLSRDLVETLQTIQHSPTIRRYKFTSQRELHDFQAALTGFKVLFDGIATTFAISRRRMVVPIHKKWEAGATRIQLVQHHDKVTQLLAFFEDFQHGRCMNFVLKGTDVFETFSRGGKAGIKFDDAKFPLPRMTDEGSDVAADLHAAFVCLDLPDLPGEHDDISILFDSEPDRNQLVSCLPAPVKGTRLSKMRG